MITEADRIAESVLDLDTYVIAGNAPILVDREDGTPHIAGTASSLEVLHVVGGGGRESNPPDGDRPSQPL